MTVEIRLPNTEAAEYAAFSDEYRRESVHVAYVAGKSARWYVKNMVGGYGENAKRSKTNVVYANGTVKDYKWFKPFYRYPKGKAWIDGRCRFETCEEEKERKRSNNQISIGKSSLELHGTNHILINVVVLATQIP